MAFGLDRRLADGEAQPFGRIVQCVGELVVFQFSDPAAGAADQELRGVVVVLIRDTADEGGQAFQFVDQALFLQEFQGAIYRGWGSAVAGAAQLVQQVVGSGWCLAVQDQAEHLAAQIGQAHAAGFADDVGAGQQCLGPGGKPHQALLGGGHGHRQDSIHERNYHTPRRNPN